MNDSMSREEYDAEFNQEEYDQGRIAGEEWFSSGAATIELLRLAGHAVMESLVARSPDVPSPSENGLGKRFTRSIVAPDIDFESSVYLADGFIAGVAYKWFDTPDGKRESALRHAAESEALVSKALTQLKELGEGKK